MMILIVAFYTLPNKGLKKSNQPIDPFLPQGPTLKRLSSIPEAPEVPVKQPSLDRLSSSTSITAESELSMRTTSDRVESLSRSDSLVSKPEQSSYRSFEALAFKLPKLSGNIFERQSLFTRAYNKIAARALNLNIEVYSLENMSPKELHNQILNPENFLLRRITNKGYELLKKDMQTFLGLEPHLVVDPHLRELAKIMPNQVLFDFVVHHQMDLTRDLNTKSGNYKLIIDKALSNELVFNRMLKFTKSTRVTKIFKKDHKSYLTSKLSQGYTPNNNWQVKSTGKTFQPGNTELQIKKDLTTKEIAVEYKNLEAEYKLVASEMTGLPTYDPFVLKNTKYLIQRDIRTELDLHPTLISKKWVSIFYDSMPNHLLFNHLFKQQYSKDLTTTLNTKLPKDLITEALQNKAFKSEFLKALSKNDKLEFLKNMQ